MKPERNDPCPCGSGKTFEKCCQTWYESATPKSAVKVPTATECNELVSLLNVGHLAELESRARLLLDQYPDSGFIWNLLGASLQMQGKDGLSALKQATKFLPDNADIYSNMGNALGDSGRLDEAEASYRRALQIDPYNANAHINLAGTLHDMGRLDEAEASYRRALQIKPDIPEVYINLGNILGNLGRLDEVEALYRQALQIKPDLTDAHYNLGILFARQGRQSEAEASYRHELEINPDHADAHTKLGFILYDLGQHMESAHHFQQAFAKRVGWHHDGDKDLSPGLVYAYIELTNKCNFHCDFCPSDSQHRAKSFMSLELVRQVCDELAKKNLVKKLHLHLMGEPTLHPDLVEVLAYASSKNIKTELVTNGSTLNTKTIPRILDVLDGILAVSLQTPTRETFKHRGNTGLGWDRYIANIRLLVREYLKRVALKHICRNTLELRVMVTKNSKLPASIIESSDDICNVMHEWRDFVAGIEAELGLAFFKRKEPSPETLATSQAEMKYPLQRGLALSFWQGFTFANSMLSSEYSLEYNKMATFCIRPFIDVAVLSNGDVTLCCLDYDGKLAVGNMKNNTIEAILKGDPTMDLRAAMLGRYPMPPFCQQCQAKTVLSDRSIPVPDSE